MGSGRCVLLQKHPRQMSPRQFVPPVFVLTILILNSCCFHTDPRLLSLVIPSYLVATLLLPLFTASRRGWIIGPLLPLVFAILISVTGLWIFGRVVSKFGIVGAIKWYKCRLFSHGIRWRRLSASFPFPPFPLYRFSVVSEKNALNIPSFFPQAGSAEFFQFSITNPHLYHQS